MLGNLEFDYKTSPDRSLLEWESSNNDVGPSTNTDISG